MGQGMWTTPSVDVQKTWYKHAVCLSALSDEFHWPLLSPSVSLHLRISNKIWIFHLVKISISTAPHRSFQNGPTVAHVLHQELRLHVLSDSQVTFSGCFQKTWFSVRLASIIPPCPVRSIATSNIFSPSKTLRSTMVRFIKSPLLKYKPLYKFT
jgi:hypothetical protein